MQCVPNADKKHKFRLDHQVQDQFIAVNVIKLKKDQDLATHTHIVKCLMQCAPNADKKHKFRLDHQVQDQFIAVNVIRKKGDSKSFK